MEFIKIGYILGTYLLASIPFGYVIGKIFGKDITREGSGNIGATNVTRTIGKKAGAVVLILDMLKGFIPVYFGIKLFSPDFKFISAIAIAAVFGHCFSIFMKFNISTNFLMFGF